MSSKKPKSTTEKPQTEILVNTEQTAGLDPEPVAESVALEKKDSGKKIKPTKTKAIRDSFTFPEHDYRKISEIKKTCLAAGIHVKKSEVLRAGLYLLSQLSLDELKQAVENVEKIKTGRPSEAGE